MTIEMIMTTMMATVMTEWCPAQDCTRVGVALAVRGLLFDALGDVQTARLPSLTHMIANAYAAVQVKQGLGWG
jgi:hypothetical protein